MKELTKRERVMRTINFQETDRIPVYDIICNDSIIEHFLGEKITPQNAWQGVYKTIRASLDMTRMVNIPNFNIGKVWLEGAYKGFSEFRERWTSWFQDRPFQDQIEAEKWIEKNIDYWTKWQPNTSFVENYRKYVTKRRNGIGDDTVVVIESPVGFDTAYIALGVELFTYINLDNPQLISDWLEVLNQKEIRKAKAIADPELVPVMLTYADIAYKGATLFSPMFLRQEFIPRLKNLVDVYHEAGVKCLYHSDGYLMGILDDLVGTGIDGLNPIEKAAGMDMEKVIEKYGRKIFIAGGIDVSELLPFGSAEAVSAECEKMIRTAGPGYFLGSTTELHNKVPAENILAMLRAAKAIKE